VSVGTKAGYQLWQDGMEFGDIMTRVVSVDIISGDESVDIYFVDWRLMIYACHFILYIPSSSRKIRADRFY